MIVLTGLLIRIGVAAAFPMGWEFDLESYRIIGELLLSGENPYLVDPDRYPYFPGWMVVEAAIVWVTEHTPAPFWLIARTPQIIADVTLILVIHRILNSGFTGATLSPNVGAAIHAYNPAAIAIIAGHGQFDSVPILFLVLAIALLYRNTPVKSALVLGVGILLKPVPMLLGPLFLAHLEDWDTRLRYLIVAAAPTALFSIPFIIWDAKAYFSTTLGSSGCCWVGWVTGLMYTREMLGLFGVQIPRPPMFLITRVMKYLFIGLVFVGAWRYARNKSRTTMWSAVTAVLLLFYIVNPLASQYLYWTMPLILLVEIPIWYRGLHIAAAFSTVSLRYSTWFAVSRSPESIIDYVVHSLFFGSVIIFWLVSLLGIILLFNISILYDRLPKRLTDIGSQITGKSNIDREL